MLHRLLCIFKNAFYLTVRFTGSILEKTDQQRRPNRNLTSTRFRLMLSIFVTNFHTKGQDYDN